MRNGFLDRYSRLESPIHRLPAGVKGGAAVAVVLASILIPSWQLHLALAGALGGVLLLSRIPVRHVLVRLLFLEPMVLGISVLLLFQPDGLALFARLLLRTNISLLAMILLSSTTPFADLLLLLRRIRIPALFLTILALMYRYLFVIVDEAERMSRARESRTFAAGRRSAWRALASVISHLLLRSSERAERIHSAMLARGWE